MKFVDTMQWRQTSLTPPPHSPQQATETTVTANRGVNNFLFSGEDMQRQRLQSWGTAMVINTLDTNHKTRHKNWGSESLVVPSCLQLWDTVEFFEQNGTIETTIDTVVTLCLIFHLKISFNLECWVSILYQTLFYVEHSCLISWKHKWVYPLVYS